MTDLTRFSVSLPQDLLEQFDSDIASSGFPTRSKAIAELIRDYLVQRQWESGASVAGSIVMAYDHHKNDLVQTLTNVQHDYHDVIASVQHFHLDHDNCLEIVAVRGDAGKIRKLSEKLKAIKGVRHTALALAAAEHIG